MRELIKPVCFNCQMRMMLKNTNVILTDRNSYNSYYCNLYVCPSCGHTVATDFGDVLPQDFVSPKETPAYYFAEKEEEII